MADYQTETDAYQEMEVPRHLDEIKKVVAQLDRLSENLEKSKDEAMVSCALSRLLVYPPPPHPSPLPPPHPKNNFSPTYVLRSYKVT